MFLSFLLLEFLWFTSYQRPWTGFTICRAWSWCYESSEKTGVLLLFNCSSQSGIPETQALSCQIAEYTCITLLPLNNFNFSSRTLQLGYVVFFVAVGGGSRVVGRELIDLKSFGSWGFFGSNSNFPSSSLPELFL